MQIRIISVIFFYLVAVTQTICGQELPMQQLKHVADGLNIEGGRIYQKYLTPDQIWANLCVVLDRPFEDGLEWQELTNANTFALKEASLLDYNEAQVNFTYATVMHHYFRHAHQIVNKPAGQTVNILIQVHRNTSGPRHVALLEQLVQQCYPNLHKVAHKAASALKSKFELSTYFFPKFNVQVAFCYGVSAENLGVLGKYHEVDIVLSFSLVAGLHPDWPSGTLLIPNQHIPFSLKDVNLALDQRYEVCNHLNQIVEDIILSQDADVLQIINQHFLSLNPQKHLLKAKKLTHQDFKTAILLQVDGLFNPSQLPSTFKGENISSLKSSDETRL